VTEKEVLYNSETILALHELN